MALYESGQMYLETIHVLLTKKQNIRSIDVASFLNYSKPSVSRAIAILKNGGYILVDANGYITMTEEGKKIAEDLYERHMVLANMLTMLGVDEETAAADACRIEHVISDSTFTAIKQHYLNYKK